MSGVACTGNPAARSIASAAEPLLASVAVIGSGTWGTAVTSLVAPKVREIRLWCHDERVAQGITENRHNPTQLPDFELSPKVRATTSLADAVHGVDAVLLVVPSAFLRNTCARLAPHMDADVPVLVLTKGVERDTGCLMAQVVEQELGGASRIGVLSGPNHAEEIVQGGIAGAVVAAQNREVALLFQSLLVCPAFRVYVTSDVVGVELCAATKNVIAIACGVAAGLGAGDNTLAALMTRGLAEISRIAVTMGADPLTCLGLAGMGDLVATCTSRHSRNRTFGEAFVAGESLQEYEGRRGMVVEGAEAAASVRALARAHDVQAPITEAVYGLLYEGLPLSEAVEMLVDRQPTEEFYGLGR